MKKYLQIGAVLVLLWQLSACAGYKFGPAGDFNLKLPTALEQRSVWPNPGQFIYHAADLAGYVIREEENGTYNRIMRILPPGVAEVSMTDIPVEKAVTYNGKIDRSMAFHGDVAVPVVSIAADLAANEALEIDLADVEEAYLQDETFSEDIEFLKRLASNHSATGNRYWIQGVLVTRVLYRKYSQIDSKTSVGYAAFGNAEGKVFNTTTSFFRDRMLTMVLLDLNALWEDLQARETDGGPDNVIPTRDLIRRATKAILFSPEALDSLANPSAEEQ